MQMRNMQQVFFI